MGGGLGHGSREKKKMGRGSERKGEGRAKRRGERKG